MLYELTEDIEQMLRRALGQVIEARRTITGIELPHQRYVELLGLPPANPFNARTPYPMRTLWHGIPVTERPGWRTVPAYKYDHQRIVVQLDQGIIEFTLPKLTAECDDTGLPPVEKCERVLRAVKEGGVAAIVTGGDDYGVMRRIFAQLPDTHIGLEVDGGAAGEPRFYLVISPEFSVTVRAA